MRNASAPPTDQAAWHTQTVDAVFTQLESAPGGLTSAEATRRLGRVGPNVLEASTGVSPWSILTAQFKNVLIVILLVATTVSATLGQTVEAVAIAVIVLLAVALGFVQEYRAGRAIDALREMAAPTTQVLRDGAAVAAAARDLVPGDVVLLQAGDRVPADARVVVAANLQVDEAALTGESVPVGKQTAPLDGARLAVADRTNLVYTGTVVTYGRGQGVVVATGMATQFGAIARLLDTVETGRTPLQASLDRVGRTLAKASLTIVAVIVGVGLLRGQPALDMVMFGIALAVAVVPEALPAVVTITLAIGVQRMAARQALVRRLPAVETLGSTGVICSDKTGTLTRDEMTVRAIYASDELIAVTGSGYEPVGAFVRGDAEGPPPEAVTRLLRAAVLASDADVGPVDGDARWSVRGDPTEGALIVAAAKAGLSRDELEASYPRFDEIPFTSERKRMTTLHRADDGVVAYAKGAPEVILASCTRVGRDGDAAPLDDAGRAAILGAAAQMADRALRVLAVAEKPDATLETAETDMVLLGLVGMIDPPRPEAAVAVERCREAGIRVVMITGDHPGTAAAVADELGLREGRRVVTGADLDALTDAGLQEEAPEIAVYARVSPEHKLRIVDAWQRHGAVTAMTGDGVNDAPALKKADIGIAMGITGTDVTKEAAAMTLTDDNFASIVAAVEVGREIYDNIRKFLSYLLAANIGEIGLVAAASALGLPLPLSAVQILTVNLVTDGLPALALAVDPPDGDLMRRPPRDARAGIWSGGVVTLMLVAGAWSALVNVSLFRWALARGPVDEAMALVFVALVLTEFVKAYAFRSDRRSTLSRPFENRWLNRAVVGELALLAVFVYTPWLQAPMGTHPLGVVDWAVTAGVALTMVPVLDLTKRRLD